MVVSATGNYTLTLGADTFIMNTANIYIQCQTGSGVVNVILPRISNVLGVTTTWGFKIYINDAGNNASVNNITITPNAADLINGSATPIILSQNGVTGHLQIVGTNRWEFSSGAAGAGTYKSYVALLDQFDEDPPTPTIILNTIGNIVWERVDTGIYSATLTGAFTVDKTFTMMNGSNLNLFGGAGILAFLQARVGNPNSVFVYTWDATGAASDDRMRVTSFEIRVYQ